MNRASAEYFISDLQRVIDDLVKDFVSINNKKTLRVVIPSEWKGRADALNKHTEHSNHDYFLTVDNFHLSFQFKVKFNFYKDGLAYFTVIDFRNRPEIV